ncbi:MAG: beta-ketoacyl-[acyl-carrier-protein] synthase family protein [Acidobacteriaceae bacterium]
MRRVAITGLGIVSALGHNVSDFWENLSRGRSGIAPIRLVDCSRVRFKNGAEVKDFDPSLYFESSKLALLDRFAQFALLAAREAVRDASIDWNPELKRRTAVVTGSSLGGQTTQDEQFFEVYRNSKDRVHPFSIPRTMANAGASQISMEFGVTGPVFTISTACSSASHAIGNAFWMVRNGQTDIAIAGGSEAPFSFGLLKGWESLRVVSPDTCRPFAKDRQGMILAEGGAMLVLEEMEQAKRRSAKIHGEIAGFGMSSGAWNIMAPSAEGAADAMLRAIDDAGISSDEIGYINAHGTGTAANDSTETRAIKKLLGARAPQVPVSSTKSMHGHALGAAGAIEAVATVLALENGLIPPTANFNEPDPECDLDYVPNASRRLSVDYALSNSFAFGGLNAVLVFRAP